MAEFDPTASTASPAAGTRTGNGFELRLERGGAHVRLGAPAPFAGLLVEHLDLKVPDIALPFDAGGGPSQFRNRLCDLDALTVLADQAAVSASAERLDLAELGLVGLEVALRDGFAEVGGRLATGTAFSLRLGLLPGFDRGVAVVPYAPRIYGPSALPAAALPHLAARALTTLGLPDDPLPLLTRRLLVSRGWKVPRDAGVRLTAVTVATTGVRLTWSREAQAPPPVADADLLAALEGSRAFAEAEALAAAGDWSAARDAWLASTAPTTHAFAADRLLSLLCVDERFHDEALDLAAGWLQRRPGFAPGAGRRGLGPQRRAASTRARPQALVALAEGSLAAGERLAAVAAAEAVLALPGLERDLVARAVDAALAAKRDHLPALRALRTLARAARRQGGADPGGPPGAGLRPDRPREGRAHAELGELLLESDPPGARLHLDRALRLAPDDADSLSALARACTAAGEHLRAVGALDRLSALRREAGDRSGAVDLALEAGRHLGRAARPRRERPAPLPRGGRAGAARRRGPPAGGRLRRAAGALGRGGRPPRRGAGGARPDRARRRRARRRAPPGAGRGGRATPRRSGRAPPPTSRPPRPPAPLDAAQLSRLAALHRRLGRHAELLHVLDRLAPLTAGPARARHPAGRGRGAGARSARAPRARRRAASPRRCSSTRPAARPSRGWRRWRTARRRRGRARRAAQAGAAGAPSDRGGVDPRPAGRRQRAGRRSLRGGPRRGRRPPGRADAAATGRRRRAGAPLGRSPGAGGAPRRAGPGRSRRRRPRPPPPRPGASGPSCWPRAIRPWPSPPSTRPAPSTPATPRCPGSRRRWPSGSAITTGRSGRCGRSWRPVRPEPGPLELRAARAALAAGEQTAALGHAERALSAGEREAGDVLVAALEQGGDTTGQFEVLLRAGRRLRGGLAGGAAR